MSHRGATLSLRGQARVRLVLSLDRHQPPHAAQAGPARPHGSHRRLDQRGDQVTHRGSAPTCCRRPARGGKGYQGMGPSPTDRPARHPGSECYQRNLHSELTASHNPPLLRREERDNPPSRLFPDLLTEQSLLAHLLLSGPPIRAHPGHPTPGRADGTISSPDPSIFSKTGEQPAAVNEDTSPTFNGTGPLIKRGSGRATGPKGPRP